MIKSLMVILEKHNLCPLSSTKRILFTTLHHEELPHLNPLAKAVLQCKTGNDSVEMVKYEHRREAFL